MLDKLSFSTRRLGKGSKFEAGVCDVLSTQAASLGRQRSTLGMESSLNSPVEAGVGYQ